MNRRDAALMLARRYPGGLEALGARMGKRPDTLRKELTAVDGYKWGVDDEEALMDMCAAAKVDDPLAPLVAAGVNRNVLLLQLPTGDDEDAPSFKCLADAAREFGEFVASVADAESDGRVTANELKHVERDMAELVGRVQACVKHLRAVHEAGKPEHLREGGDR